MMSIEELQAKVRNSVKVGDEVFFRFRNLSTFGTVTAIEEQDGEVTYVLASEKGKVSVPLKYIRAYTSTAS